MGSWSESMAILGEANRQAKERVAAGKALRARLLGESLDRYIAVPQLNDSDDRWYGEWEVRCPVDNIGRRDLVFMKCKFYNETAAKDFAYLMNMANGMRIQTGG